MEPLTCLRCRTELRWMGTESFLKGARGWGGLFTGRDSFDVYLCERCGHTEFFADGVGEELRPLKPY